LDKYNQNHLRQILPWFIETQFHISKGERTSNSLLKITEKFPNTFVYNPWMLKSKKQRK
jgi:hypothetical protein